MSDLKPTTMRELWGSSPSARKHDDVAEAVAARDAEWRAAVERVRQTDIGDDASYYHNAALDAMLRAMEAPDA